MIAATSEPNAAYQTALGLICAHMAWPVGHIYLSAADQTLISAKVWHVEDPVRFGALKKITEATPLAHGIGLPGRVFASKRPK